MVKILTLIQEQFNKINKSESSEKIVKELLNIPLEAKISIGDTAVKINNAKPLEVYKSNWKNSDYYYIVIDPLDERTAKAYSVCSVYSTK